MVPSSSGLGHGPLKAVTRVRLSLGSPIQKPPLSEGVFVLCNPRRRTSRVRAGAKRKQAYARSRHVGDDLATLVVATALRIKMHAPLSEGVFVLCNPRRRTSRVRAGAKRKQAYARSRYVGDDLATLVVATALRIKMHAPPLSEGGFVLCNPRRRTSRVRAGAKQIKG